MRSPLLLDGQTFACPVDRLALKLDRGLHSSVVEISSE